MTNPGTAHTSHLQNTARGLNFHKEFFCFCPLCQPVGLAHSAEQSILVPRDRHYAIGEWSFALKLVGCGTTCQKPTNTYFLGPEPSKTVRWDKTKRLKTGTWTSCFAWWNDSYTTFHGVSRKNCMHKNDLNPVLLLFFISVRDRNHKVQA